MPLNHTFSLAMCNTKLIVKLALVLLVLAVLFFAVFFAILDPLIAGIRDIVAQTEIDPGEFINHPFVTFKEQIVDKCVDHLKTVDLGATIGYFFLTYFFFRFFCLIPQLPVTKVLYNKMTTGYDVGLFNALVSTGFQNLLLSLILATITTVLNTALLAGFCALVYLCMIGKTYVLIPFVILLYIGLLSVKTCLFSQWMPEICASEVKNIFVGIKNALKGTFTKFRKNFLCFLTLNLIWFAIVTATALLSVGVIPLVSIPVFVVLRSTLSLTLNFSYHKQKYFIDNGTTIYTPTKKF